MDEEEIGFDTTDFRVVVKQRGPQAKPWRWEIYRAGRSTPVQKASVTFATMVEASRAGKEALRLFVARAA
jgi:hypothetical protein